MEQNNSIFSFFFIFLPFVYGFMDGVWIGGVQDSRFWLCFVKYEEKCD